HRNSPRRKGFLMLTSRLRYEPSHGRILTVALLLPLTACMVGPNFSTPAAPVADKWLESSDPSVQSDHQNYEQWWTVFNDPTLNRLIDLAYHQNLTLLAAGTRVLEARATLGVAIGELYPQTQGVTGNVGYFQASKADLSSNPNQLRNFWHASLGTQ